MTLDPKTAVAPDPGEPCGASESTTTPASSEEYEGSQFRLLVRCFLQRLFESDLLPEEVDIRRSVIWLAALFAAPAGIQAARLLGEYGILIFVVEHFPNRIAELERATWGDELLFVLYSMTAVGFLTVLVWESVFPDRRDAVVLGTLPVRDRTVLTAKLTALVIFAGGFSVAINLPSALGFGIAVTGLGWTAAPSYFLAHMIVTPVAGLFVFVCLIALQTTLAALLHQRLLRMISVLAQLLFVIALIEMLIYSPVISHWLGEYAQTLTETGQGSWLPPLWFLGLYETVLGSELASYHRLAGMALLATLVVLGIAVLAYACGYRRVLRRTLESPSTGRSAKRAATLTSRLWAKVSTSPTQQAVVAFVSHSLARNRRHRLLLAIYIGVGIAMILAGFIRPLTQGETVTMTEPTVTLLSIPLILSFFTLVGLRVLFAVPIELRANWVFQMAEQDDKMLYLSSARAALHLLGLLPLAVITLPLYSVLWDPAVALGHTVLWMLLGALLIEALLVRFRKIPFTCSYLPGTANVRLLGPLYLVVALAYGFATAQIELLLLTTPTRWIGATIGLAGALVIVRIFRRRADQRLTHLRFEEQPEATIQQLHLMNPHRGLLG